MKLCTLMAIGVFSILSATSEARAAEAAKPAPPRSWATIRATTLSGFPDYVSLSASFTRIRFIDVDVGANYYVFPPIGHGTGYYARAGYKRMTRDDRDALTGKGSQQSVSFLAGYRYLENHDIWEHTYHNHGASLNVAIEEVKWLRPHLGLSAHMVIGLDYWFHGEEVLEKYPVTPDVRISAGLAF